MENNETQREWTPVFTGAPRHHLPFRSVFMPIVPCVLDGVISLLELIAKLEYIVNQYHDAIEQNHTDIMNLYEYIESALDDLREYIDTQDAAMLQAAKDYTDAALALIYNYIDDHDAATLHAAEAYTDAAIADLRDYVDAELAGKQDLLTFDQVPTDGSTNPVESNGIFDALAGKQDLLTFDQTPTAGSTNPVESQGIKAYVDGMIAGKYKTIHITEQGGSLVADMTWSEIDLYFQRGAILIAEYRQYSGDTLIKSSMYHYDYFDAHNAVFFNSSQTLTIDDTGHVTIV